MTKLCKLKSKTLTHNKKFLDIVAAPQFYCGKCSRVANQKKALCKGQALSLIGKGAQRQAMKHNESNALDLDQSLAAVPIKVQAAAPVKSITPNKPRVAQVVALAKQRRQERLAEQKSLLEPECIQVPVNTLHSDNFVADTKSKTRVQLSMQALTKEKQDLKKAIKMQKKMLKAQKKLLKSQKKLAKIQKKANKLNKKLDKQQLKLAAFAPPQTSTHLPLH